MSSLRGSKNYVWDIAKPLGQGATSLVYIGREKRTGEEVAVKVFTPQSYQRPRNVQTREFEVMRRLNHENIVRLLGIEEEQTMNGGDVIVMELCPNGSLYNVLDCPENSFGLCEEEFLLVLKQVSAGVKHLRDNDIIHRDIKPGNILRCISEDGRSIYKLTDFGAARELQDNEEFMSLYGTEEYLHPDMYEKAVLRQARGQQFGVSVDLWSLGVTFYHAASGNLPFRPYGGRKNKETMHQITTKKEPGVISGIQLTENGSINYSKDLPSTCRLSLGLKRLITPFMSALLEKDPARTWPFDQFFEQVAALSSKVVIDVFCPSSLLPMKVYADRKDTLQRLKELIAEQTEIPPQHQLLLIGGQKLSTLVKASQPVCEYRIDTTAVSPIIVFNINGIFPTRSFTPSVGQFPQLTQSVAVDYDYPQCKRCCGVLYSIIEAVKTTTETTSLLNMAVHMFCSHLKFQVEVVQESLSRLGNQMGVVSHWQNSVMAQLKHQLDLLNLTLLASGPASAEVNHWINLIKSAQHTHRNECDALYQKLQNSSGQAMSKLKEAVGVQATVNDWDTTLGCTPADRCSEKVKVMLDRMKKILGMFKDNRTKRHLNYNEEQIHKFEKNKLGELCTQARSMLTDNCLRKRKNLYGAYKLWFEKGVQCQDLVNKVGRSVAQISDSHTQLITKLKHTEIQCSQLVDDCVEQLRSQVAPPVIPPESIVNGGLHINGSGDILQNSNVTSVSSLSSRRERLDSLSEGIQTSKKALEELSLLVTENTQLIRNFGSLTEEGPNTEPV